MNKKANRQETSQPCLQQPSSSWAFHRCRMLQNSKLKNKLNESNRPQMLKNDVALHAAIGKGDAELIWFLSPFFGLAWHKLCLVISFAQVGCLVASWLKEDSLICRRISFGASISASTPALPLLHRLTFCRTPALNLTICPTIQSFNAYLSVVLVYELLVAVSWTCAHVENTKWMSCAQDHLLHIVARVF